MQQTSLDDFEEQVRPIVARVLRRRFRGATLSPQDDRRENERARECSQQALMLLCARFSRALDGSAPPIIDVPGYAARVAHNVANEEIRPINWTKLSNRIRRVLSTDHRFATWEHPEWGTVAGYAGWRAQRTTSGSVPALREIIGALRGGAVAGTQWERFAPGDAAALLEQVFDTADGPLPMDRLVHFLAEVLGIVVEVQIDEDEDDEQGKDETVSRDARPDDIATVRNLLEDLWGCARLLRREWRLAFLMNLPSIGEPEEKTKKKAAKALSASAGTRPRTSGRGTSRGEIELFPAHGIASIAEIGEALDLAPGDYRQIWAALSHLSDSDTAESTSIYALWPHFPLQDKVIGRVLDKTGQQVLDLRKLAIRELAGCMKAHGHCSYD
jgi:hypothetical protein